VLLKKFSEKHPMLPVEPEPIQKFLEQWNGVTRRNYFKIIRSFYRWLTTRYGIVNPTDRMELPKVKKKIVESLSPEEVVQLLEQPRSRRDRAALLLLVGCGLRAGEVVGLTFGDIGTETLAIRSSKTDRGVRTVPLLPEIRSAMLALKNGNNENAPIFWGEHPHKPLQVPGLQGIVKKAFAAAGIKGKKASPHTLRHTFGRNWVIQGGDSHSLRDILGHSSIQTTEQYVALADSDLITKNKKHNPLKVLAQEPKAEHAQPDNSLSPDDHSLFTC